MDREPVPSTGMARSRAARAALAAAGVLGLLGTAACSSDEKAEASPAPVVTAVHKDTRYSVLGDDPRLLVGHWEFMTQPVGRYVLRYDRDAKCLYVEKDAENGAKRRAVPVWIIGETARPLVEGGRRGLEYAGRRIMEGDSFNGAPQGTPEGLGEALGAAGLPVSCGGLTELAVIGEPVPSPP